MLERICKKTEFEVEGWRKILPLMNIMKANVSFNEILGMKLKMTKIEPIIKNEQLKDAMSKLNFRKLFQKQGNKQVNNIRNSWLYDHFTSSEASFQNEFFRFRSQTIKSYQNQHF